MLIGGISSKEFSIQTESDRFIAYAKAYLQTSRVICEGMTKSSPTSTWPFASVTMFLATHAVELFLKGMILLRDSSQVKKHHELVGFKRIYDQLFPEPELTWDLLFEAEYLGFLEDTDTKLLNGGSYIPSILNRYPIDGPGIEWQGTQNFRPKNFLHEIDLMGKTFNRIETAWQLLAEKQGSQGL